MKKITLIVAILFVGSGVIYAQAPSNSPAVAPVNSLTNTQSKKQESAVNSTNTGLVTTIEKKNEVKDNSGSVATITLKQVEQKPTEISGSIAPVTEKKVDTKVVPANEVNSTNTNVKAPITTEPVTTPAAKPAIKQVDVPSPATQMIPAGLLKTSPSTTAPVTNASTVKTVELSKTTGSGTLVAIPALTIATDNGVQQTSVVTQSKMTEQVVGQPKAGEVIVTPASTESKLPKLPAVTAQSTEKAKGKN